MASIPLHSDVYPAIDYSITAGTLKGKVAVIAGASRGIGQQIAQCLAKAGADVALLSISGNNADTKVLCEKEGVKAGSWKVDITDEKETERVFKEIVKELGEVDVLVNNAATQRRRPYAMDNVVDWWRVVEINFKGVSSSTEMDIDCSLCVLFNRFCRV
jgi:NAD(P)-dependent dehydrogenase (short-subunit alcohol dehydrogenase family)